MGDGGTPRPTADLVIAILRRHGFVLDSSRLLGWQFFEEQPLAGRKIRPDGTVRDAFMLPRGYWEAKNSQDDLSREIRRKIDRGYPTTNIIFEDTLRAILCQDSRARL